MLVGYVVKLVMVVILYIYMYSVNKKRDRQAAELSAETTEREGVEAGMLDLTELENKNFRYIL